MRWPIARTDEVVFTLQSGCAIQVLAWDWWAEETLQGLGGWEIDPVKGHRLPFIDRRHVVALHVRPGPYRWRGWRAE